ncbi:hypothetical protein KPL71_019047 [Citrus sinensis]|uniref:Uncharacterized protein n=1 Tax=Citrus sinensis TaxID=2711 RepID=A0ACB8K456_CITSI|nr:hypothetical protein KPL71_019047 [Citrus sinensis]
MEGDAAASGDFDMQVIGNFLSFASRGDRVGLNQMLREGTSPNVQDYDRRTALHLAASEGHAPIVELLLQYKANLNLKDRWQRTPLTDARLYGHRDICRILEVNGGKDFIHDQPLTVRNEKDSNEVNFDISELNTLHSSMVEQGNLKGILSKKVRLDLPTALRYALDIARGMNYLHEHKPFPIVHNHLDSRNLLQDEGDHLKIGEYWVQMFYEQIHPNQENSQRNDNSSIASNVLDDTKKDICSFGYIFYQMLEGKHLQTNNSFDFMHLKSVNFEPKFHISRCPNRLKQLIAQCTNKDPSKRPTFAAVIITLEEVSACLGRSALCPVC